MLAFPPVASLRFLPAKSGPKLAVSVAAFGRTHVQMSVCSNCPRRRKFWEKRSSAGHARKGQSVRTRTKRSDQTLLGVNSTKNHISACCVKGKGKASLPVSSSGFARQTDSSTAKMENHPNSKTRSQSINCIATCSFLSLIIPLPCCLHFRKQP